MKIFSPVKTVLLFAISLFSFLFYSCNKEAVVSGTGEFIHYTVNGTAYNFDSPADSVFNPDSLETSSFIVMQQVLGARIPNVPGDYARILFDRTGITQGSNQPLSVFAVPQIIGYAHNAPTYSTSATTIMLNITEYGAVGAYIAGNFSCLLTDPPPTNTNFTITCSFRIKRTF
jgi:ABC-type cobalt transport system substrate-binding protein